MNIQGHKNFFKGDNFNFELFDTEELDNFMLNNSISVAVDVFGNALTQKWLRFHMGHLMPENDLLCKRLDLPFDEFYSGFESTNATKNNPNYHIELLFDYLSQISPVITLMASSKHGAYVIQLFIRTLLEHELYCENLLSE